MNTDRCTTCRMPLVATPTGQLVCGHVACPGHQATQPRPAGQVGRLAGVREVDPAVEEGS